MEILQGLKWPRSAKAIHRATIERVLHPGFFRAGENVTVVAPHGLGKTMIRLSEPDRVGVRVTKVSGTSR
jgi:hypothetical protein